MEQRRSVLALGAIGGIILLAIGLLSYLWWRGDGIHNSASEAAVRTLVADFGKRLKEVPLTGTPDITRQVIGQSYGPYITPELLEAWQENLEEAPGRATSSPWPERIDIVGMIPQGEGYVLSGNVILMTSKEVAEGGNAGTYPAIIQTVRRNGVWLIAAYEEQQQG